MKDVLNNVEIHNFIDFFVGLLMSVSIAMFGFKGIIVMVFLILHLFFKQQVDEREKLLFLKAYDYAFRALIVVLVIAHYCCTHIFTPYFVIAVMIFLRGLFGIIVFARN